MLSFFRARSFLLGALIGACIFSAVHFLVAPLVSLMGSRILMDFSAYWSATRDFLHGRNPYIPLYSGSDGIAFIYPPSFFWLMGWIAFFSANVSQIIFTLLSVLCFLSTLHIFLPRHFNYRNQFLFWIAILLFISAQSTQITFFLGQINFLVLALCLLSFSSLNQRREFMAGLFLGMAISIKLMPIILLLGYFFDRKYKPVIIALGFFISLLFLTPNLSWFYLGEVFPSLSSNVQDSLSNQSLFLLFWRMFESARMARYVSFFVLGSFVFLALTRLRNLVRAWSLLALSALFGSFTWDHHFVFFYPLVLWEVVSEKNRWSSAMALMFLFSLIVHPARFGELWPAISQLPLLQSYQLITALLFLISVIFKNQDLRRPK